MKDKVFKDMKINALSQMWEELIKYLQVGENSIN